MKRMNRVSLVLLVALCILSSRAIANEFTDVIDAADFQIHDPFDLNLTIGYLMLHKSGKIRRETRNEVPHSWDHYAYRDMFEYKHIQHLLNFDLEVGLFRDLSIRFGLPLILNDSRELSKHKDMFWDDVTGDGNQDVLISLPFKSSDRSGVDHFTAGLWWNPLDQSREQSYPNWTLFVEGRFGVGDTMKASCAKGQNVPTAPAAATGVQTKECDSIDKGGVSRGVNELHFGTRLSRRFGMLDPFFGFDVLIGWAKDGTAYFIEGNKSGQINKMPPVVGTLDFGMEIVPWEMPEQHRKLAIGIGAGAAFHSEGREYTPLFDALGTSGYFLDQEYVDFNGNGVNDGGDETAAIDGWSGMTDIENFASFFGRIFIMIQPAKYIKFRIGGGITHETEHFITKTDMCSADKIEAILGQVDTQTCERRNYGYRPELDTPGNRFRAEKNILGHFMVDVTAMF